MFINNKNNIKSQEDCMERGREGGEREREREREREKTKHKSTTSNTQLHK